MRPPKVRRQIFERFYTRWAEDVWFYIMVTQPLASPQQAPPGSSISGRSKP